MHTASPPSRPLGRGRIAGLVLMALVVAFLTPMPAAVPASLPAAPRTEGVTEHVVVISVDGLRPDAIAAFGAVRLQELMRDGSHSLDARTVLPSNTIPSHTSMVTGVEPEVHGVRWNDRASVGFSLLTLTDRRRRAPTIFEHAAAAGLTSAAIVAKSQMRQLGRPGPLERLRAPLLPLAHFKREWDADRVVAEVEAYLLRDEGRPNLLFLHLADPDLAGHDQGWMSDAYGAAVRSADRAVARILAAADHAFGAGGYTVLLTSDHGGMGYGHGGADPREVTIPWIAAGRGVAAGVELDAPIRIADTAATALRLLGVPVPEGWSGRPVAEALDGSGEDVARR